MSKHVKVMEMNSIGVGGTGKLLTAHIVVFLWSHSLNIQLFACKILKISAILMIGFCTLIFRRLLIVRTNLEYFQRLLDWPMSMVDCRGKISTLISNVYHVLSYYQRSEFLFPILN